MRRACYVAILRASWRVLSSTRQSWLPDFRTVTTTTITPPRRSRCRRIMGEEGVVARVRSRARRSTSRSRRARARMRMEGSSIWEGRRVCRISRRCCSRIILMTGMGMGDTDEGSEGLIASRRCMEVTDRDLRIIMGSHLRRTIIITIIILIIRLLRGPYRSPV